MTDSEPDISPFWRPVQMKLNRRTRAVLVCDLPVPDLPAPFILARIDAHSRNAVGWMSGVLPASRRGSSKLTDYLGGAVPTIHCDEAQARAAAVDFMVAGLSAHERACLSRALTDMCRAQVLAWQTAAAQPPCEAISSGCASNSASMRGRELRTSSARSGRLQPSDPAGRPNIALLRN
jgi:hypothetical protein